MRSYFQRINSNEPRILLPGSFYGKTCIHDHVPPQSNLAGCTNVLRCRIFSKFR
nr:MAG TPA: hypothetical protein [Caudoviricetes sp.]